MSSFNPTPQQDRAMLAIRDWLADPRAPQFFYLAGWAGTGKTTLVKEVTGELDGVLYAAYTGKAASVLQKRSGLPAQTLHSLLYLVTDPNLERLVDLRMQLADLEEAGKVNTIGYREVLADLKAEEERAKKPRFTLNPESALSTANLLVLDECSMVNEYLGRDTLSFRKKVLVLGDPAQLPPVKGGGFFTNREPDLMLTDIRRQALDNPIIRWSKIVREGGDLPYGKEGPAQRLSIGSEGADAVRIMMEGGGPENVQLLTGKNETRRLLNRKARVRLGRQTIWPEDGDKMVCLRNVRDYGVLNGVQCTQLGNSLAESDAITLTLRYEDRMIEGLPAHPAVFDMYVKGHDPKAPAPDMLERWLVPMDYGYAMTVHKSQGSEWPHVVLCDDGFGKGRSERRAWIYTGITRASDELTIIA